jgi:hypothetical protein
MPNMRLVDCNRPVGATVTRRRLLHYGLALFGVVALPTVVVGCAWRSDDDTVRYRRRERRD